MQMYAANFAKFILADVTAQVFTLQLDKQFFSHKNWDAGSNI